MKETRFLPPAQWRGRIAPTEYDESHQMLRGTVHDPTARRMGGVAGHAGLFSTADDLARFAQEMLTGFQVLSRLTVEKMTTPQQPPTASDAARAWAGISIRHFRAIAESFFRWVRLGTPGSPEPRYGSIR